MLNKQTTVEPQYTATLVFSILKVPFATLFHPYEGPAGAAGSCMIDTSNSYF